MTVYIVDDEQNVRDSLKELFDSMGVSCEAFDGAHAFLDAVTPESRGCVLLDICMPGMTGIEAQRELARRQIGMPVIGLSAYVDTPTVVTAMSAGAMTFLEKPYKIPELVDLVNKAIKIDEDNAERQRIINRHHEGLQKLTAKEREVLDFIREGLSSKQIAEKLNGSQRTVETHRASIMTKMGYKNLVELVKYDTIYSFALFDRGEF